MRKRKKTPQDRVHLLITHLKEKNNDTLRLRAVEELGQINDQRAVLPAIPALVQALKDPDPLVGEKATDSLSLIGSPAVNALLVGLRAEEWYVRRRAAIALGRIGEARALPSLLTAAASDLEALYTRQCAAEALLQMGGRQSLPLKILADRHLSPTQRLETLRALQEFRDWGGYAISCRRSIPDLWQFCTDRLQDSDPAVQEGAREIRALLDEENLLRASQRNTESESEELLRAAHPVSSHTPSETLLRSSQLHEMETAEPRPTKRSLWQRLFRSR